MKKNIFRIAALLMAGSLLVLACKKSVTPADSEKDQKEDQKEEEKKDEGGEEGSKIGVITIDGDFADWDLITEASAAENDYIDIAKGASGSPIKVIKASSDAENVYIYAEVEKTSLAHSSICGEWGSSMDGVDGFHGDETNDAVSEEDIAFNLFFDPDANAKTGFFTYVDDEEKPIIPELGCEMAAQNLFFFNVKTGKLGCAWSQTNVGPVKEKVDGEWVDYDYNGDYFQQDNWDSETIFHRYGWQNDGYSAPEVEIEGGADGTGDNIAPAQGDLESKVDGNIVYIEFSIAKEKLVNWSSSFDNYAWGVCYNAVESDGAGNLEYTMWAIGPVKAAYKK